MTKASAKPTGDGGFAGFPPDAFEFLTQLDRNNEREWFERNKPRYESSVRGPAMAFIAAMGPQLARIAPHFVADVRPVGGSLMRIHRDVRFSSDKRPYKTNVGIHFRHGAGKDVHAPGIYLHVEPSSCFFGVGLWHPEPEPLAQIRARIVAKPEQWRAALGSGFAKHWKQDGESLVRPPKGFDPDNEHIDDLRRKDHVAMAAIDRAALERSDLPRVLADRLRHATDYLRFLCAAVGQPF